MSPTVRLSYEEKCINAFYRCEHKHKDDALTRAKRGRGEARINLLPPRVSAHGKETTA